MALQPSTVASTTFKIVRKGYDPDQVRAYLKEIAGALQAAQDHASTVEAKARQAVARAQEAAQQSQRRDPTPPLGESSERDKLDDTATISRTLLLAQRTADDTVAAAEQEAAKIRAGANEEADRLLSAARQTVDRAADQARAEARRAGESERQKVESELQQLLARLEFLRDDVAQMEAHAERHRERLTQAADELGAIAKRTEAGLGELRRPVLSAAADLSPAAMVTTERPSAGGSGDAPLPGGEASTDDAGTGSGDPGSPSLPAPVLPAPPGGPGGSDTAAPPAGGGLEDTAEVPVVE